MKRSRDSTEQVIFVERDPLLGGSSRPKRSALIGFPQAIRKREQYQQENTRTVKRKNGLGFDVNRTMGSPMSRMRLIPRGATSNSSRFCENSGWQLMPGYI